MKTKSSLVLSAAILLYGLPASIARAQDVDSVAPVVVKTVPEAGVKDVAPGEVEIRVTFSKKMGGGMSWSSAWKDSKPEEGDVKFTSDHRTCVLKVKLEPDKTYGYWINSQNFHNFTDTNGRSAVPYLLVFHTADK